MKFLLRFSLLVLLLSFSLPARSSSVDENLPDAQALAQLEFAPSRPARETSASSTLSSSTP